MRRFGLIGLALFLAYAPVSGAGLIVVDESHWLPPDRLIIPPPWPHPPRPFPPPHCFAPLQLKRLEVKTRVEDQVAVTTVAQDFFNPNNSRLEGTFLFPVPKGAQLDKFSMEIDGHQVEAELLPSGKARQIYEDIVRKAKDPALLEYSGHDLFKARIFPIEPRSTKHITLSYIQLLRSESGLVDYVVPLSAGKYSPSAIGSLEVKIDLSTKAPLKSLYSPTHDVEIQRHGPRRATIRYAAENAGPESDLALYFAPEPGELGLNLLTFRERGEDGYFLLLASPGVEMEDQKVLPKDVLFVLDTSGSMAGKKIEQARKALLFCVENLNEDDHFEIIRFATDVEPLFHTLAKADGQHRAQARKFVQRLKPSGGTAIHDALAEALRVYGDGRRKPSRPRVIVFLTDGLPTIGVTDENEILKNVKRANSLNSRIFCFGLGTDVNTRLLDRITESARAFSQYVLPEEDIEIKVSSFFARINEPVLANPEVKFTGGAHPSRFYPSPLPDFFKGDQLVLVGRYSGSGATAVGLEGDVEGARKKFTFETQFPSKSGGKEFIARLWATRRVGYLLDEIRLHGENSELRNEVTELARRYGIVTPYTAFLIVEDEAANNVPAMRRSFQRFDQDKAARSRAEQAWSSFQKDSSGDSAFFNARQGQSLKAANAPAPAMSGSMLEANRALGLPLPGSGGGFAGRTADSSEAQRLADYSQQSQFVAGKNFFQNGTEWADAAIQKLKNPNLVQLQFGSREYFQLAATNSQAQAWLALGRNVSFELNGQVYQVRE